MPKQQTPSKSKNVEGQAPQTPDTNVASVKDHVHEVFEKAREKVKEVVRTIEEKLDTTAR